MRQHDDPLASHNFHYSLIALFFFFNDTATTEIYTLSLHDALPIIVSTQTTLTTNSGNVWDDTGGPIPPPQRHDYHSSRVRALVADRRAAGLIAADGLQGVVPDVSAHLAGVAAVGPRAVGATLGGEQRAEPVADHAVAADRAFRAVQRIGAAGEQVSGHGDVGDRAAVADDRRGAAGIEDRVVADRHVRADGQLDSVGVPAAALKEIVDIRVGDGDAAVDVESVLAVVDVQPAPGHPVRAHAVSVGAAAVDLHVLDDQPATLVPLGETGHPVEAGARDLRTPDGHIRGPDVDAAPDVLTVDHGTGLAHRHIAVDDGQLGAGRYAGVGGVGKTAAAGLGRAVGFMRVDRAAGARGAAGRPGRRG